jgi:hypothetical protein
LHTVDLHPEPGEGLGRERRKSAADNVRKETITGQKVGEKRHWQEWGWFHEDNDKKTNRTLYLGV